MLIIQIKIVLSALFIRQLSPVYTQLEIMDQLRKVVGEFPL